MIDIDWLKEGVEYGFYTDAFPKKYQVIGFYALGTEKIFFRAKDLNGKESVLGTFRDQLGFHIRELPIELTTTPKYDLNRLNQKLLRLVGNPLFDTMNHPYNNLYVTVLRNINEYGVLPMILGSAYRNVKSVR